MTLLEKNTLSLVSLMKLIVFITRKKKGFHSKHLLLHKRSINPLSPNGDQHQFSPNDIHTLLRDKVMRITETIIIDKTL